MCGGLMLRDGEGAEGDAGPLKMPERGWSPVHPSNFLLWKEGWVPAKVGPPIRPLFLVQGWGPECTPDTFLLPHCCIMP